MSRAILQSGGETDTPPLTVFGTIPLNLLCQKTEKLSEGVVLQVADVFRQLRETAAIVRNMVSMSHYV